METVRVTTQKKMIKEIKELHKKQNGTSDNFLRYDIEIYRNGKVVTSRYAVDGDLFDVTIITQMDNGGDGSSYEEADWYDVDWIKFTGGYIGEIETILDQKKFIELLVKMREVADIFCKSEEGKSE